VSTAALAGALATLRTFNPSAPTYEKALAVVADFDAPEDTLDWQLVFQHCVEVLGRQEGTSIPDDPVEFAHALGFCEQDWQCPHAHPDDPGCVLLHLDEWQCDFLRAEDDRQALCCSRQSGKSEMSAIKAVHRALKRPKYLAIIIAPTQRQSIELMGKAYQAYDESRDAVGADSEQVTQLRLSNGSRIVALPGRAHANIRGYSSLNLLIIDEAAFVTDSIYRSARPMLAVSRGHVILLSTPHGKRGFFYEIWVREWAKPEAERRWRLFRVSADMIARLRPDFLAEELADNGEWWFKQEYMCEFIETATQVFRDADIDAAVGQVEAWDDLWAVPDMTAWDAA
jgi:hypothetical protein